MTTTDHINTLKAAALDPDELIKRSFLDCLEALARFAILDRPPRETVRILEAWRSQFENLDRKRHLEKARRP